MKKFIFIITLIIAFTFMFSIAPTYASNKVLNPQTININNLSTDTVISDVMTYDEIVKQLAIDKNISIAEAQKIIGSPITTIMSKDGYPIKIMANTYRTITNQFTVTSEYKPSMRFYCRTSEGGSFHGIIEILNVDMSRSYQGRSYAFGGSVYTNLENANTIYYSIDGDFYEHGTTTVSGGVKIGIGDSATINFELSNASNWYAIADVAKRFTW